MELTLPSMRNVWANHVNAGRVVAQKHITYIAVRSGLGDGTQSEASDLLPRLVCS